jgi:hypothetical protein
MYRTQVTVRVRASESERNHVIYLIGTGLATNVTDASVPLEDATIPLLLAPT